MRDTVGKVSSDLLQKEPDTRDPIELMRECLTDYEKNLIECIDRYKKVSPFDFYVVVLAKKERLMPNVIRNYFYPRITCPTPDYDQTVYKYYHKDDCIEFIWVIPSRDTCILLKENALQVAPNERELLRYILDFSDGSLFALAKKLNGEEE